jgi:hypothetical protein
VREVDLTRQDHSVSADPTPGANALLDMAQEAAAGFVDLVPRFVDRSRRQLRFVAQIADRLRCGHGTSSNPFDGHDVGDAADAAGPVRAGAKPAPRRPQSGPDASQLAIPDYDSLAASQVLPRLEGLTPDEMEAVRSYEAAHRGRRTILGRIGQLQT